MKTDHDGWHKFNIDDENTWPPDEGYYWIAIYQHKYFYDLDGNEFEYKEPLSTHGYFHREFQVGEDTIDDIGWRYRDNKDVEWWKEFIPPELPDEMKREIE